MLTTAMALTVAIAVPARGPQAPPTARTYTDRETRVAFDYPQTWVFTKEDRKNPARFTIPIEGSSAKAELKVIDLDYGGSPEAFQETQATVISRLNQTLVRQWQIEVLGVPMLLTKVRSAAESGETTTLAGLLYANTPRKFNFRLTAPSSQFDAVELAWQGVLESLRTTTGALPASGDAPASANGTAAPAGTPVAPVKEVRTEIGAGGRRSAYRGEVALELPIASAPAVLFMPKGWRAEPAGSDGALRVSSPTLDAPVTLKVYLAQADSPGAVMNRLAAERLATFKIVEKRYDEAKEPTQGDGAAASVRRTGTAGDGAPRFAYDAVYVQGAWFVSLSHEDSAPSRAKGEARALADLLDRLRIEAKP